MSRANRSWKVRGDYIDRVKNLTKLHFGRQEELAEQAGVARSTVSKYLNGQLVDIARFKEISFFLGFGDGKEIACLPNGNILIESITLNINVGHLTPTSATEIVDTVDTSIKASPASVRPNQDWQEAIHPVAIYGRSNEVASLSEQILTDRCRMIAILGMGGIGKTTLAYKLVEKIQEQFDYIIWRSLIQAPPLSETLNSILKFISPESEQPLTNSTTGQISSLLKHLQTSRCLIVLDNMESILCGGADNSSNIQRAGYYLTGYADYGDLLQQMGEATHQSCLLLTSREKPKEIAALEGQDASVRSIIIKGLENTAAHGIIQTKKITGSTADFNRLIQIYDGNPLALKFAASTIQELFAGDIAEFLATGTIFFGQIGELLDEQFDRSSPLEKQILFWLAINQEATSIASLSENLTHFTSKRELLEALESLSRRPLIEKHNNLFSQQPVVIEYVTQRLIDQFCQEIVAAAPDLLNSHALLQAQAKDYLRKSQIRLILNPIIQQLQNHFKTTDHIVQQCKNILVNLQKHTPLALGYAGGNLINILRQLQVDLTGYNFSYLTLRQAYLCNINLRQVNFAHADLGGAVFNETFGGILSVDLSKDGKLLTTSGTDGIVRLWRITDGKLLWAGHQHSNWVFAVAFSPDDRFIASGSGDSTVRLWDVVTGKPLNCWRNIGCEINTIAFSSDGHTLAIGGSEPQAKLLDINTGECLQTLRGHSGNRILAIVFSPDGRTVVTGSTDHTLKRWEVETGKCLQTFIGHNSAVRSLTVSHDGQIIASGSLDNTIKLWRVASGKCWQTLAGHQRMIQDLAFSPAGDFLASAGLDHTLRIWHIATGQCSKILAGHIKPVWSLAYSPDGKTIISGGDDHTIKFWNTETGQCLKTWQGNSNAITAITYPNTTTLPNSSTSLLASGSEDHHIRLWDINRNQCCQVLTGHKGRVVSLRYSPDGQTLLSGSWDGTAKLWDITTGQCLKTFHGHTLLIWAVTFSPDGRSLATASDDGTVRLWDINGKCLQVLSEHQGAVQAIAFSPDAQTLVSGGIDGILRFWNIKDQYLHSNMTITGHTTPIRTIIFSNDGRQLFSTSKDSNIKVWELATGRCTMILEGHSAAIWSIALSPDGRLLASGGEDKVIKIWDLASGKCLKTLAGHLNMIIALTFHPQESYLISGSLDETIQVWDIGTGQCSQTLRAERPYEAMNITGVTGLTTAQKDTLKTLGAWEI
jgi:WD40 repeat protein